MAINHLDHLEEFHKLINSYQASPETINKLAEIKLVLLLGASSIGRNTIIRKLVEGGSYHAIISDTTRQPRVNDGILEQNGGPYWFRSEDDILADIKAGQYIEAEVLFEQQVSGQNVREIDSAYTANKIAINEVDKGGIDNIVKLKPDTTIIMLLPPSFEEWQRRLKERGFMEQGEFIRRMRTAKEIFSLANTKPYFKFVINDYLDDAVKQVDVLAKTGDSLINQDKARELAKQLELQTKDLLDSLEADSGTH